MKRNIHSLLQIFFCSLLMGLSAYAMCSLREWSTGGDTGEKMFVLGAGIGVGIAVYLVGSYWMKNEEMLFLAKMLRKKKI